VHFIKAKHPELEVEYSDWQDSPFGFSSNLIFLDVESLKSDGYLRGDRCRELEILSLTDLGNNKAGTSTIRGYGRTLANCLRYLAPRLSNGNADMPPGNYRGKVVFSSTNLNTQVGELRKEDIIEDSEFGVGYIVVNAIWIPVETIRLEPKTLVIAEDF
jgi:hypothetical protein